jgi:WD40 repeat protein
MAWIFRAVGAALLALVLTRAAFGDEKSVQRADKDGDPLPSGAIARIGTARFWHGRWDGSEILFRPDGKELIAIRSDGYLHVTDFATGKDLRLLDPEMRGNHPVIALAPDGRTLACGAYEPFTRIWDITVGKELRKLEGKINSTAGLAFSHDGKLLAIAGSNGQIQLCDTRSWREISSISTEYLNAVVFLPDNKTLLVAQPKNRESAMLRWFDTATGKEIRKVVKPSSEDFQTFAFSANGTKAAVVVNKNQLHLFNAVTGAETATITLEKFKGDLGYYYLAFSRDGRVLACANGSRIIFMDAATGRISKRWDDVEPDTHLLTFSPDGKTLLFAPAGIIQAKDIETGKSLLPRPRFSSPISDIQFAAKDGALLVSGEDGSTASFDALTGKQRSVLLQPDEPRLGLIDAKIAKTRIAADGKSIALVGSDFRIHHWDALAGKLLAHHRAGTPKAGEENMFPLFDLAEGMSLSPNGRYATFNQRDNPWGPASIWDTRTEKSTMLPEVQFERGMIGGGGFSMENTGYSIPPRAFSPKGSLLAVGPAAHGARTVQFWDLEARQEQRRITWKEDWIIDSMAFPDEEHLVTVFKQWSSSKETPLLRIWSTATGRELRSIELPNASYREMISSPDGRTLALASAKDGKPFVLLLDMATLRERRRFPGEAGSLCFSRDGRLLATNPGNRTVLIWDLSGICPDGRWSTHDASTQELERLWTELQSDQGAKAYRAMWSLAAAKQAPAFLAAHVRLTHPSGERLAKLIAELDDLHYATREKATLELKKMGELASTAAQKALESAPSPEAKQRLESIIAHALAQTPSGEQLGQLRAIEALEHARTPEARRVLESVAAGDPALRLTREAKVALARMSK